MMSENNSLKFSQGTIEEIDVVDECSNGLEAVTLEDNKRKRKADPTALEIILGTKRKAEKIKTGSEKKFRAKRSAFHQYFNAHETDPNKKVCRACLKVVPYNGTRSSMKYHVVNKCHQAHKMYEQTIEDAWSNMNGTQKLGNYIFSGTQLNKTLDALFVAMKEAMIMDQKPMTEYSRESVIKTYQVLFPGFKGFSRFKFKAAFKKDHELMFKDVVAVLKKQVSNGAVSITTDGWSSQSRKGYCSLTVHLVDNENFGNKRAEETAKLLHDVLIKFGLDQHVYSLTTGNASDMILMSRLLREKISKSHADHPVPNGFVPDAEYHFRCMAHVLNIISKAVLNPLDEYVDRARNFLRFFKRSEKREGIWNKICQATLADGKALPLPSLDIETRWNSTWKMLYHLCKKEKDILKLCPLLEDHKDLKTFKHFSLNKMDFLRFAFLVKTMKDFKLLTENCSREKSVTISSRIGAYNKLQESMMETMAELDEVCQAVDESDSQTQAMEKMRKRLENENIFGEVFMQFLDKVRKALQSSYEDKLGPYSKLVKTLRINLVAQALDIRTPLPYSHESPHFETLVQLLVEELVSVETEESSEDFDEEEDVYDLKSLFCTSSTAEVNSEEARVLRYLSMPRADFNLDVLDWWKNQKAVFPKLRQLARKVLAVQSSSVSSERAFSVAKVEYSGKESLQDETFMMRCDLRNWRVLLKKEH
eukprot:maker-scaffold_8-snap-gene-2.17-mRNA-1 protein AED:0.26 eAED:0.32 QI:0/0/0/1/1/1/2/0/704